jgi:hypothetical protein
MDTNIRQSTITVHYFFIQFNRIFVFGFRIIELILSSPMNLPFELRICSDQSRIDELCNYTNRHYHLEEIIVDEIDQNKDSVLIPVAHYIKENFIQINLQKFFPFFLHVIHVNHFEYFVFLFIYLFIFFVIE